MMKEWSGNLVDLRSLESCEPPRVREAILGVVVDFVKTNKVFEEVFCDAIEKYTTENILNLINRKFRAVFIAERSFNSYISDTSHFSTHMRHQKIVTTITKC